MGVFSRFRRSSRSVGAPPAEAARSDEGGSLTGESVAESPAPEELDAPPVASSAAASTVDDAEQDGTAGGGATIPKQQSAERAADSEAGEDARQ